MPNIFKHKAGKNGQFLFVYLNICIEPYFFFYQKMEFKTRTESGIFQAFHFQTLIWPISRCQNTFVWKHALFEISLWMILKVNRIYHSVSRFNFGLSIDICRFLNTKPGIEFSRSSLTNRYFQGQVMFLVKFSVELYNLEWVCIVLSRISINSAIRLRHYFFDYPDRFIYS